MKMILRSNFLNKLLIDRLLGKRVKGKERKEIIRGVQKEKLLVGNDLKIRLEVIFRMRV